MRQASAGAWRSRPSTGRRWSPTRMPRSRGWRASIAPASSAPASTILQARAELVDPHTVIVQPGGRKITARYILVATGGRPVVPDVPGAGHAITSNEAFHLESLPKSILIVGGGYIAVEFAGIFAGLGRRHHAALSGEKILRGFDEELRDSLTQELFKREIDVRVQRRVAAIEKARSRFKVTLKDGEHDRHRPRHVRHGPQPQHRGHRPGGGGRQARREGRDPRRCPLAHLRRAHLRRRRRDGPRQPHARRHPRGPRLRRHRVRQQADRGRPRAGADRRLLHARDRHRRPAPRTRRASASPSSTSTRRASGRSSTRCRGATSRCS